MSTALSLRSVSKTYSTGGQSFKALDHVDLDIEEGRLVVILGPSGAGKSTLLNLIGGMDTPSEGTITAGGTDISRYTENQLADYRAEHIGFIFQFYNILPTLTVLENVNLVADLSKNAIDGMQALEAVGLADHLNKFPNQLSGGEQQRVSIARAIAKNPSLLLCDEPTGALDSATGVTILKILKEQAQMGKTVIIVTHNSLFADIADVVIRLKNGKIKSVTNVESPKNIDDVEW
ncbi:MAG: ABC transporter ATP-binding protein [Lachnospiraceae bacterium]|nr:ABC transporter ATP-binding protein [Lachnospiraceae bacterium]